MINQFGQRYRDIYLKENAIPLNKLTAMFGSAMNFEPIRKNNLSGRGLFP